MPAAADRAEDKAQQQRLRVRASICAESMPTAPRPVSASLPCVCRAPGLSGVRMGTAVATGSQRARSCLRWRKWRDWSRTLRSSRRLTERHADSLFRRPRAQPVRSTSGRRAAPPSVHYEPRRAVGTCVGWQHRSDGVGRSAVPESPLCLRRNVLRLCDYALSFTQRTARVRASGTAQRRRTCAYATFRSACRRIKSPSAPARLRLICMHTSMTSPPKHACIHTHTRTHTHTPHTHDTPSTCAAHADCTRLASHGRDSRNSASRARQSWFVCAGGPRRMASHRLHHSPEEQP